MKVLVISYSQTGQLDQIIDHFLQPLEGWSVERYKIRMRKPFDFPWNGPEFFGAMPDSVLEKPAEIEPLHLKEDHYDLIIFGYQPWFLSPSIPATSILHNEVVKKCMRDTDVLTIIGARNMWLNAQMSVVKMIQENGGRLVGNVPLIDRASNLPSAVSIVHWMMKGKKTRKWRIFPKPGISEEDIEGASQFGEILREQYPAGKMELQKRFLETGKLKIGTDVLFIEERAKRLFLIWANLIEKRGTTPNKRRRWLVVFKYYLIFALFVLSPIIVTVYSILIRPFTQAKIRRKKENYFYLGIDC